MRNTRPAVGLAIGDVAANDSWNIFHFNVKSKSTHADKVRKIELKTTAATQFT